MILEVIVDLVFANHTTITYEVHEAKGISTFGADREGRGHRGQSLWSTALSSCLSHPD